MQTPDEFFSNCFQKNIQSLQIFIFFLLYSNQKRFPKLPGLVGKCCQIFGIFSLLIPKAYLMSLIVGNDNYTLAFGGLYLLEFIVMISFNKIFWSSFGGKQTLFTYVLFSVTLFIKLVTKQFSIAFFPKNIF
jgi:hypothetical protein